MLPISKADRTVMHASTAPWHNPEAGHHPLPDEPAEIRASLRAAERCLGRLPYLRLRFGPRGDAFTRTDSGFLTTLAGFPLDHVIEQVQWLAGLLACRGMPRWLMETHLDILADELVAAIPDRAAEFRRLRQAAAVLRRERRVILSQASFDALASAFAREGGNPVPHFGEVAVSAVCDEAFGIAAAVTSVASWLETSDAVPAAWRGSALALIQHARQAVRPGRN